MYAFIIKLLTPIVKLFLRVRLEGEESVPEGERFVICANHLSNWDPILVVICTGIEIRFLAKESLFKVPIVSSLVKAFGAIPIKRGAPETAPIRKSIEVVKEGGHFSIFPQGKRLHIEPSPDQAKNGVGLICHKSEAGVLPIGIYTKNYRVMPFRPITVRIGRYIPYSELRFGEGKPDYGMASEQIFTSICELARKDAK